MAQLKIIYSCFLVLVFMISVKTEAQEKVIKLWQKGIPNSKGSADYKEELIYDNAQVTGANRVTDPTLTVYSPQKGKENGTAVIICPGGGYGHLAINKEGYKLAAWFAKQGVTGFVLKNRLPSDEIMNDKTIGPIQDVQRAIRYVRESAASYKIDTSKIGIMGFSAGGHLAATASTHYKDSVYDSQEGVSARPDFSILIYPVISMKEGVTHRGSRDNLLGKTADYNLVMKYSEEEQVNSETPMAFLVHAADDGAVPVANSINYFTALNAAGVPVEMHIYEEGGHGFGMGVTPTADSWPAALSLWMKKHSLISN
ncbi:MAG: alpha/beta hydrolase [Leeuwenhoekiella sp.]